MAVAVLTTADGRAKTALSHRCAAAWFAARAAGNAIPIGVGNPPDTPAKLVPMSIPATAGLLVGTSTMQQVPVRSARTYPCRPPPGSLAERLACLQVYRI